jgi:hypothetical protein
MAVAAPARKTAPAPAPSRTTPPRRKAAPSRKVSAGAAAPATKPSRRAAPARRAPQRAKPRKRAAGGQLIPLAVGRTAVAVRQLPDSSLMVRLTRGRAWIAVLGALLAGIVALNVVTLSFAATVGKVDAAISALDKENSVLDTREATKYGVERMRAGGAGLGLHMPTDAEPQLVEAGPDDVATAAQRLAAMGTE